MAKTRLVIWHFRPVLKKRYWYLDMSKYLRSINTIYNPEHNQLDEWMNITIFSENILWDPTHKAGVTTAFSVIQDVNSECDSEALRQVVAVLHQECSRVEEQSLDLNKLGPDRLSSFTVKPEKVSNLTNISPLSWKTEINSIDCDSLLWVKASRCCSLNTTQCLNTAFHITSGSSWLK